MKKRQLMFIVVIIISISSILCYCSNEAAKKIKEEDRNRMIKKEASIVQYVQSKGYTISKKDNEYKITDSNNIEFTYGIDASEIKLKKIYKLILGRSNIYETEYSQGTIEITIIDDKKVWVGLKTEDTVINIKCETNFLEETVDNSRDGFKANRAEKNYRYIVDLWISRAQLLELYESGKEIEAQLQYN